MNENYTHSEMPKGVEADIIKGMYLPRAGNDPLPAGSPTAASATDKQAKGNVPETDGPPPKETKAVAKESVQGGAEKSTPVKNATNSRIPRVQLIGSGTILREAI